MPYDKETHLDEDDIIRAVVDQKDLPQSLQHHLADCPSCQARYRKLSGPLFQLGRIAQDLVPGPKHSIVLPEPSRSKRLWFLPWQWPSFVTGGLAITAVLAFLLWFQLSTTHTPSPWELLDQEMTEDQNFMSEIRLLEEYALPQIYSHISGEFTSEDREAFEQFLIPTLQEDTHSQNSMKEVHDVA